MPLVPRDRRYEVTERMDYDGNVLVPLDEAELAHIGASLKEAGVEAVIVSFLHAYANTAHEERAREILAAINPAWEIVTGTSVVREYYEFERTSTAVVQGYLQPLVARYARNLTGKLGEWGFQREVLVMQSNGGLAPLAELDRRSAYIVRSGPAAGVTAAAELAGAAGFRNVITADMGGTSFDVAVVVEGEPTIAELTNLEFRIPLRLPMIDVHTIGAGGGSIASLDRGGMLQVGPRSAGAVPGPVAYRRGGTEPTVTDANVVLGRIDPESRMGGPDVSLDIDGAKKAVGDLGCQARPRAAGGRGGNHCDRQSAHGWTHSIDVNRTRARSARFRTRRLRRRRPAARRRVGSRSWDRHDAGAKISGRLVRDGMRDCRLALRFLANARAPAR